MIIADKGKTNFDIYQRGRVKVGGATQNRIFSVQSEGFYGMGMGFRKWDSGFVYLVAKMDQWSVGRRPIIKSAPVDGLVFV
jgi:hypothetical protein